MSMHKKETQKDIDNDVFNIEKRNVLRYITERIDYVNKNIHMIPETEQDLQIIWNSKAIALSELYCWVERYHRK